ncbi:MAG: DHH family phosphoesterase, partial [Fimbriiglobus sp.]|nr:DHH family phosphoesterase [Fimbriiglobus sp.]
MAHPSAGSTAHMFLAARGKGGRRSDRFLAGLGAANRVVFVSHVQPDPDSLGSMWGLAHLVRERLRKPVLLTQDGGIFRAENRAMVDLLDLQLTPVADFQRQPGDAVVMVDSQPGTGRHSIAGPVAAVIDHHVTPGDLSGVNYADIRPELGATCTVVTGYLFEQKVGIPQPLATALLYGIETELSGFPREGAAEDDDAVGKLYPLADKDLLAQIRHARLPKTHFDVLAQALRSATVHGKLVFAWVDPLGQPEQAAEVVDFLIRYEDVDWAVCCGVIGQKVVLSARAARANAKAGEMLANAVGTLGNAGGHERRAGGCVVLADCSPNTLSALRAELARRIMSVFGDGRPPVPLVGNSPGR